MEGDNEKLLLGINQEMEAIAKTRKLTPKEIAEFKVKINKYINFFPVPENNDSV